MFYVYIFYNLLNGKRYVGKCNNFKLRLANHKSNAFNLKSVSYNYPFYKSIRKYINNLNDFESIFKLELLEEFECETAAFNKEIFYIDHYMTNIIKYGVNAKGYNLTNGGEGVSGFKWSLFSRKRFSEKKKGCFVSLQTKKKLKIASTGKRHTLETRKKISESKIGIKNHQYGKKLSNDVKIKISKSLTGIKRKPWTELRKLVFSKLRKGKNGKKHSQELKDIFSKDRAGDKTSAAKLTWDLVNQIRKEYSLGENGYIKLSKKYNMSVSAISHIIKNRTWVI